jgi:hypothetical protein
MKTLFAAAFLAIFVIGGALLMYFAGTHNRYVDLENQYDKQMTKLETFHDKMWKTIKSQTKITDKAKDGFKDIYVGIMEGRYSKGGGQMMLWLKEHNPQFDQTMYTKLMTTVEAQRNGFFKEQDIMQGIVKEGNDLVRKLPSSIVCSIMGKKPFEFTPISSSVSKKVMETRIDDELHLD